MKNKILVLLLVCTSLSLAQQRFEINLNDRGDDKFKVTLYPDDLDAQNNIYHFAATAPGMYQIIDAGRFVRSFKAYDKSGKEIKTDHPSTNEWTLSEPENVYRIEYAISETWDTVVQENHIYKMGGTSLEEDHAVINGPDVFGYFEGRQSDPVYVKLLYPSDWDAGTALKKDDDGYYRAENYDHIVDSPFMLGRLSYSTVTIDNTIIDLYTYSKTGMVESDDILESTEDIFHALDKFMEGMPVDRYVLLFHFEDETAGAWEHSYSSFYVYQEAPYSGELEQSIRDVIAHETFHMVTPLNIHSEIIEQFNFVKPVLSEHIWLYESVTEWASHMMQLRAGLVSLDEHLLTLRKKFLYNDFNDPGISLKQIALNSFELQPQFQIVYQRGAIVAELMDILILSLSDGKKGLRETIVELSKDYGPDKAFNEAGFFDEFASRTYPEVRTFIKNYIEDTQPLPAAEYLDKIGVNYYPEKGYDSSRIHVDLGLGVEGGNLIITNVPPGNDGIREGDVIVSINDQALNLSTYQVIFAEVQRMKVGDKIKLKLKNKNEEKDVDLTLKPLPIKHIIQVNSDATPEQLALREAWMKNL